VLFVVATPGKGDDLIGARVEHWPQTD